MLFTIFYGTGPLAGLELASMASLASQGAPGIPLSYPSMEAISRTHLQKICFLRDSKGCYGNNEISCHRLREVGERMVPEEKRLAGMWQEEERVRSLHLGTKLISKCKAHQLWDGDISSFCLSQQSSNNHRVHQAQRCALVISHQRDAHSVTGCDRGRRIARVQEFKTSLGNTVRLVS